MDQLVEDIHHNNPSIKDSSLLTYARILNILYQRVSDGSDPPSYKFFEKKQPQILKYLDGVRTLRYKKTILASLFNIVRDPEVRAKYKRIMNDKWKESNDIDAKQEKSDKEVKNWISLDEVKRVYENLKQEVQPLFKRKNLTRAEHNKLVSYVILSLYVLLPPRRCTDYTEMLMLGEKPSDAKEQVNYIDGRDMVFNVYKTAKFHGSQKVKIPPTLMAILRQWKKVYPDNRYLLFDFTGKKLSNVYITHYLNRVFSKNISVNMLRHIYISEKVLPNVPKLADLEQEAHDMGHTINQQALYKKFDK